MGKYANEMTDDVIHSTQYYIKYINRAILANLQCKLGRKHTHAYKKFSSHGNSVISSPYPHDFNMLVIFSLKNVTQGHNCELAYLYARWIMHIKCCQQKSKWNVKGGKKSF